MRGLPGRRLWVPAVLSFSSVVGCPSGGDDVGDDSSGTPSTTDASSSGATMSTTVTSTTISDTTDASSGEAGSASASSSSADGSSGETGPTPSCTEHPDQPSCATDSQCSYFEEFGGCIRNCEMITDLAVCGETPYCVVYGDTCGYEPIA
jgi:hypothetical protein